MKAYNWPFIKFSLQFNQRPLKAKVPLIIYCSTSLIVYKEVYSVIVRADLLLKSLRRSG